MNKLIMIIFTMIIIVLIAFNLLSNSDSLATQREFEPTQSQVPIDKKREISPTTSSTLTVQSFDSGSSKKNQTNKPHNNTLNNDKKSSESSVLNKFSTDQMDQNAATNKLQMALSKIPDTYHHIFQWSGGIDQEIVDEYVLASKNQELQRPDINIEQLFNQFIYQHEMSSQLSIELLNCTSSNCEVYGREFSSSAWGIIKEDVKQTPWWPFSKDVTRNGIGKNGEMVFLTITSR